MKKNDLLLAAGILAVAALLFLFQILRGTEENASAVVTVDGEITGTYCLNEDRTVEINDSNRLVISGGSAYMEWADCPDQVCVRHRRISRDGESIICLPNRVVISVESREESGLDSIAQ